MLVQMLAINASVYDILFILSWWLLQLQPSYPHSGNRRKVRTKKDQAVPTSIKQRLSQQCPEEFHLCFISQNSVSCAPFTIRESGKIWFWRPNIQSKRDNKKESWNLPPVSCHSFWDLRLWKWTGEIMELMHGLSWKYKRSACLVENYAPALLAYEHLGS